MSQLSDVEHFIIASRQARSTDELGGLMEAVTREMGFHSYSVMQNVRHFCSDWKRFGISDYPCEWVNYFVKHRLHPHDPVHLASLRTARSFRYEDMPTLIELTETGTNVLRQARRYGDITDGFCVPTHVPGEAHGTCTFVVRGGAPLPQKNLLMAQLIGGFAYDAARQILFPRHDGEVPHRGALTTRQLECVVLVARGKTDWEIARLLGITEETVTAHINEARRRYQVSRRAQLPVQALYRGDIGFPDIVH